MKENKVLALISISQEKINKLSTHICCQLILSVDDTSMDIPTNTL